MTASRLLNPLAEAGDAKRWKIGDKIHLNIAFGSGKTNRDTPKNMIESPMKTILINGS